MNVFDILGPVMIGPSSSHTAGAARIGLIARELLNQPPVRAEILLHGSFASTYQGHGTDRALIAGILGMAADDARLRTAPALAKEAGMEVVITTGEIDGAHPNTALITLTAPDGRRISVQGSSIGGGNIRITKIDGMEVTVTGEAATLIVLHRDRPGTIAAVTEFLAENGFNVCSFHLTRTEKGGRAVMTIELDGSMEERLNRQLKRLPNVYSSTLLEPI